MLFFRRQESSSADIETLVSRAQNGDGEAFGRIYDQFVDQIYRFAFFKVSNPHLAEDLTQTIFLKALERLGSFRRESSFASWLFTIARNTITDFYRTNHKKLSLAAAENISSPDSSMNLEAKELLEKTFAEMGKLSQEEQEVLRLHAIEEYSFAQIEKVMNKKEGALRIIKHRALKKLKEKLDL